MRDVVIQIREAIAKLESDNNYNLISKRSPNGDRAYGKYQVMGKNIPVWTKQILKVKMTPQEFLNNPTAQDDVAYKIMLDYYTRYGRVEDVASAWFSGRPYSDKVANKKDAYGTSVKKYVEVVIKNMGSL